MMGDFQLQRKFETTGKMTNLTEIGWDMLE